MSKQTELLMEVKEEEIWGRIKVFFRRLFYRQDKGAEIKNVSVNIDKNQKTLTPEKQVLQEKGMNFIQGQDNELLELQKKYRAREIKEADLTKEQIKALSDLYDKQISELRASNEARKQRLLKYREKMNMANA